MKAALMRSNKVLNIITIVIALLALIGILPSSILLGFSLGYLCARFVMLKFVSQLDILKPLELPKSNLVFNMLVYSILFVATIKISVCTLLSAFLGLMLYRKLFFIFAPKIEEGGMNGNNY